MSNTVAACPASPEPRRRWQRRFIAMLPSIVTHAKIAFRHIRGQDREDKVQEVVANSLVAFRRLVKLGKVEVAYPKVLAKFAVAQIKDGRMVGASRNCKDVSADYCQRVKKFTMERLDVYDDTDQAWQEILIPDKHCTPAELAASRIDVLAWFDSLKPRIRRIAEFLSAGHTTTAAAKKFRVSQGRISQLRRELAQSWHRFIDDEGDGAAMAV